MTPVEYMETLATKYHVGQTRKDKKTPYIAHPAAVVSRLRAWGIDEKKGEDDIVSLAVGWGHDLLEDTEVSEDEILAAGEIGLRILAGIKRLTFKPDYGPELTNAEYDKLKQSYLSDVAKSAPPEILIVKIADRLCNSMDFVALYRYDKAQSYVRAGIPLFDQIPRIRGEVGETVKSDVDATMAEIDRIVVMDDAWERLSGGSELHDNYEGD